MQPERESRWMRQDLLRLEAASRLTDDPARSERETSAQKKAVTGLGDNLYGGIMILLRSLSLEIGASARELRHGHEVTIRTLWAQPGHWRGG